MAALQVSENWDDDFEFQVEKRKISTATAKTEATENWDDDFEDSRQSPKKIIQRRREESWDDEDDDEDDDENSEFGLFAEEDRTVTVKSRRAALARLSAPSHLPHSPTSSVFSVPTTIHTYSSTAHLRPTSAFTLIPPSPPIHRERERRRLRKKSRPKPQAVIESVEIPSQERHSFSNVDLPRPASKLDSRRTSTSDLSIRQHLPLVKSAAAESSIGPSKEPVSIPQTPTKGAALLSRIGSVKKWGARRKRGESTAPTDFNESVIECEPISNVNWDPRKRKRGESTKPADTIPTGSRTQTVPSGNRDANEVVEGKRDVLERAENQKDRMKYAGLGLGRVGARGGGGEVNGDGEYEENGSPPKIEKRNRRQSLSRLLVDRDKENKGKDTDGMLEKEKDGHEKGKGKEGTRSFMGSVRRISLISVGRHKKSKSGGGGFVGVGGGGGSPAYIPPVPTLLPSALGSQVSLKILSSANTASGQRSTSSHIATADLRRAASLSSPKGGFVGFGGSTATSASVAPVRSNSRPPSISSSTKRRLRKLSKSKPRPRKSEDSSQDGGLKTGLFSEQEQAPFFYPSEGRDTTLLKTPTRSASSTAATTIPLLPPIELQPPSPPRTVTTSHIQRRSRAYTTNEVIEGLELETLLVTPSTSSSSAFFTSTSSLSGNNVGASAGAVGVAGIFPLPPLSPNKLSAGKSPSQSQQSVSLGRSTAVNVGDEGNGLSLASGSGSGGLPRRNSLGDLKIPARISQAQVGLRRDLGMVREFASNVEQLKELQNTYNSLVVEVRTLLDTHVQLRQRVQQPPLPQPVEKPLPPSTSSLKFFSQFKSRPKIRARSNTVGSTTTDSLDVDSAPLDVAVTASQEAYNRFLEAFWSINYKYRVSWECAELLIELGSGNVGADSDGSGVMSAPPSAASTSVSAPTTQQHIAGTGGEGTFLNLEGRERAITLVRDESRHSITPPPSPTAHYEPQTHCQSQPSSAIVSTGSNSVPGGMHSGNATSNGAPPLTSPLTSPPSISWRSSTGKHDLSQRQLVLLREMLNNNGDASIVGTSDNEGGLRPPPHFPLPKEDLELRPSTTSPYPSPYSQLMNRDWRWGDPRNSTITFSEDRESGLGTEGGRRDRKMDNEKKRRSVKLGMVGIRDMLRALKKSRKEELQQMANSNPDEVQSTQQRNNHLHGSLPSAVALAQPMMHSTTSLSTLSSIGSKSVHNQTQVHQQENRLPSISRIPSQIRRRGRSSTGPELMRSSKGPSPTSFNPSFFTAPKPLLRRPSLASIFRMGSNKTRPAVLQTGADVVNPAALSPPFSASERDLSAVQCSSGTTGTGGEYSKSTGEEEEDWDRMDSASDLGAAAVKALQIGIVDRAYDVSATVRGRGRVKTKAEEKKGVSPYLQNQSFYENNQHHPLPLPASSSSTSLGIFFSRHSIMPKRSFSASQTSVLGSAGGDGQHPPNVPSRLSRHSNFEEQQPTDTAGNEPPPSFRISSSKSAPTTTQSKFSTPGSSRPSSSRSTKFPNAKTGSVRSVLPHLVPSSHVSTGLHGQQPSPFSSFPDPKLGMIMTPENIKPLLENAKEVHVKLHECIVEIRALINKGAATIGQTGMAQAHPNC